MRKWIAAGALVGGVVFGFGVPAFGQNPPGTGPPSQSCQSFSATTRPGLSYLSPGSPFNEGGGVNSANGGTGGAHYSEKSQYDVACFQVSQH
jgi:hypothetical protein